VPGLVVEGKVSVEEDQPTPSPRRFSSMDTSMGRPEASLPRGTLPTTRAQLGGGPDPP